MKISYLRMAGMLAICAAALNIKAQEKISLGSGSAGIHWKLRPQEVIGRDSGWVDAIVPGTVFASYVAAGLEKDPNFGDNIYKVERARYDRNFWYRTSFATPAAGDRVWLNFKGINRKAEIYLNGVRIRELDRLMQRWH